jgi:tetratricopeptide (TPR) repeat protein
VAGEPVRARPAGPAGRLARWCRRRPGVALLTAGLLLTFAAGFAGVLWEWRRAEAKSVEVQNHAADAQQQRAEAEASARLGLDAVNRFFKRVHDEGLLTQPGNQAQRRQILADGLGYYRRFLDKRRADPEPQADLADAYSNIAFITAEIGDKAEALASYREALRLYEALWHADPSGKRFFQGALGCHTQIGYMLRDTGRPEEALTSCEQALRLLEEGGPDMLDQGTYPYSLAGVYGNLVNMHRALGHRTETRASYEKVLAIQERLAREHPQSLEDQVNLAKTYGNLAGVLDRTADRLRCLRRAREIREKLVKANPTSPNLRRDLARSVRFLGLALAEQGLREQGLRELDRAVIHLRRVLAVEPSVTLYQSDLGEVFLSRSNLYRDAGRYGEALEDCQEAAAIFEQLVALSPSEVAIQRWLAVAHEGRAQTYEVQGKGAEALVARQQELAVIEKLGHEHPTEQLRRDVAGIRGVIAGLRRELAGRDICR